MSTKPVLFIDIDGCVADSVRWWLNLASADHCKSYRFEDHTEYSTMKCLGIDLSQYYGDYKGVGYVDGARKAILRLQSYYDIVYVTVGQGGEWLRYQGLSGEIVHIKNRSLLRGYALIDDCQKNLEGFIGKTYLVKQPWNPSGVTWEFIEEELMADAYNNFASDVQWSPV